MGVFLNSFPDSGKGWLTVFGGSKIEFVVEPLGLFCWARAKGRHTKEKTATKSSLIHVLLNNRCGNGRNGGDGSTDKGVRFIGKLQAEPALKVRTSDLLTSLLWSN